MLYACGILNGLFNCRIRFYFICFFFFLLPVDFLPFQIIDLLKWNGMEWNKTESIKRKRKEKVNKLALFSLLCRRLCFSFAMDLSIRVQCAAYSTVQCNTKCNAMQRVQWKCVNSQCEEVCGIAYNVCVCVYVERAYSLCAWAFYIVDVCMCWMSVCLFIACFQLDKTCAVDFHFQSVWFFVSLLLHFV